MENIILIVSGGDIDEVWLASWLSGKNLTYCIAADRGLESVDRLGLKVDMVLGDYDSVDENVLDKYRGNTEVVTYPAKKDYTDTHLALKKAIELLQKSGEKDTAIYIAGATGSRLDHVLTNISVLKEALDSGVNAAIIDKHNKIYLANKPFVLRKTEQYGKFVSFVSMSGSVTMSFGGMKYDIADRIVTQGESICQSNEIEENEAVIDIKDGVVIVIESFD